jgi:hypothetical protein
VVTTAATPTTAFVHWTAPSDDAIPPAHAVQDCDVDVARYVPAVHVVHAAELDDEGGDHAPVGHAEHAVCVAFAYVPPVHATHVAEVVAPIADDAVPAGHCVHGAAPVAEYEPPGQSGAMATEYVPPSSVNASVTGPATGHICALL